MESAVSRHRVNIMLIISFAVLAMGTIAGSIYLMNTGVNAEDGMRNYFIRYLNTAYQGIDRGAVAQKVFKENTVYLMIIFICGFFRAGTALTASIVAKKGFITGFTCAACIKLFGAKGVLVVLAMLPCLIIVTIGLICLSSISGNVALCTEKRHKKLIIFYVFFVFLIFSIFCVAAFFEGYLTTTFMKWISPKIIQ